MTSKTSIEHRQQLRRALEDLREIQKAYRIIEEAELVHAWGTFHDWLSGYYSRSQSPLEFAANAFDQRTGRKSGLKSGLRNFLRKLGLPKSLEALVELKNELEKEEKKTLWRQCEVRRDKYHAVCVWTENAHQFEQEKAKVLSVLREFQLPIVYRKYSESENENNLFCDLSLFALDEILLTSSIEELQSKLNRSKNILLWDWPYFELHRGFANVLRCFDEVWTSSVQAANLLMQVHGIRAYAVGPYISDFAFSPAVEEIERQRVCLLYREEIITRDISRKRLTDFFKEYEESGTHRLKVRILAQNPSESRFIRRLQQKLKTSKKIKIEPLSFKDGSRNRAIEAVVGINLTPHAAMDKYGYAAVFSKIPVVGMPMDWQRRDDMEHEFHDTGNPLLNTVSVRKHDLRHLVRQVDRLLKEERYRKAVVKKQRSALENQIFSSQGKSLIRNQLSNSLPWT